MAAIRQLSSAYVSQFYESLDAACPSPVMEAQKPETVQSKVSSMFEMMKGNKNG